MSRYSYIIGCMIFMVGVFPDARTQDNLAQQELIRLLQQTLESCRKENERLQKLVPDSLRYSSASSKRPLAFRANNITWREDGKQISMYQVISELKISEVQSRVSQFLQSRGYVASFADTVKIEQLVLPELHPVKVRAWWVVEEYEPGFSVLKAWFRMPDGTYLNPDNYPGYHTSIQSILKRIIHGAE